MPLNVQAQVIDIRVDQPTQKDRFFVDTNVWFWVGYSNASVSARPYQTLYYPQYLAKALMIQSVLMKSTLSLAELIHIIERTELEIFNTTLARKVNSKEFRHDYVTSRLKVIAELKSAWAQADMMTDNHSLDVNVDSSLVSKCLSDIDTHALDGYDLFILNSLKQHTIDQLLTDDKDFATIPNIQVFTANDHVISEARAQGKLVIR